MACSKAKPLGMGFCYIDFFSFPPLLICCTLTVDHFYNQETKQILFMK